MIDVLAATDQKVVVSTGRVRVTFWQDAEGKLHRSRMPESRAGGESATYVSPKEMEKASRIAVAILDDHRKRAAGKEQQLKLFS